MAASSGRTLMKDFHHMMRNLNSFTDGQVEIMDDWEEKESLDNFNLLIKPNAGPYQGGGFEFNVDVFNPYPESVPYVTCLTPIYHPNIDPCESANNICLSLLDDWDYTMTLEDLVQGLLFLLYNPQLDDVLSPIYRGEEDYDEFVENVEKSLMGEEFDDSCDFEWNLHYRTNTASGVEEKESKQQVEQKSGDSCTDDNKEQSDNVLVDQSLDKDTVEDTCACANATDDTTVTELKCVKKLSDLDIMKWNSWTSYNTTYS